MPEDLPCMSYASSFGRLKRGQNNLWTGPKQPVSQRTVCKDNKKAVMMTIELKIKNTV